MQSLNPGTKVFAIGQRVRIVGTSRECRLHHHYPLELKTAGRFRYLGGVGDPENPNWIGLWFMVPVDSGIIARAHKTEICGSGTLSPSQDVILLPDNYGMIAVPYESSGFDFWRMQAGR
ncbi:MAG: hypothetical protein PHU54_05515 [Candidatus Omnitrophica bacterium]|jgi:hypothetical protein|nr:hypothetical protein [Candidatus Omnitrophota bacterium]